MVVFARIQNCVLQHKAAPLYPLDHHNTCHVRVNKQKKIKLMDKFDLFNKFLFKNKNEIFPSICQIISEHKKEYLLFLLH